MNLSKQQIIDFAVLCLRWYLAIYMFNYGWGKLWEGQFSVHDPAILEKPIKEIDQFYIAWYLFSLSKSFNIIVGASQVLGAILLLFNRTVLLGALMLLPIIGQIFLIDVAFSTNLFGSALPARLAGMLLSDLLILFYYKDKMIAVWKILTTSMTARFKYHWAAYLLVPILGFLTDFVFALLTSPVRFFVDKFL